MDLECWLQCPKCKKQSKFMLKDILARKPAKCRLCQTPLEIDYAALDQTRDSLAAMAKNMKDKGGKA
ncbi:MAG: hypothetical protein M0Z75_13620 [Nitrospiraceae bacterium]|nr:hypothetical protein [Nitrospiraceae bacterium]